MIDLIITGCIQGLILTIITYGIVISFRLLSFSDLTGEASYALGGAILASLTIAGLPIYYALIIATLLAAIAGIITGLISLYYRINSLLSGIIVSTMIYSINLRIMGKPNISLFSNDLFFNSLSNNQIILVLIGIIIAIVLPISLFLHTELGLRFRAVGLNLIFAKNNGIPVNKYILIGLFISNAYIAFAGGLMVQLQHYMDVGMGSGILIHALASLMIGESIVGNNSINKQLIAPFVGSMVYQQIQGIVLYLGLAPSDLKLLTGLIVLIIIALQKRDQDNIIKNL